MRRRQQQVLKKLNSAVIKDGRKKDGFQMLLVETLIVRNI